MDPSLGVSVRLQGIVEGKGWKLELDDVERVTSAHVTFDVTRQVNSDPTFALNIHSTASYPRTRSNPTFHFYEQKYTLLQLDVNEQ